MKLLLVIYYLKKLDKAKEYPLLKKKLETELNYIELAWDGVKLQKVKK